MRKEAVYTLLLNVTLFPGMRCTLAQDPRFVRFSVIEDGTATHYNLKVTRGYSTEVLLRLMQNSCSSPARRLRMIC